MEQGKSNLFTEAWVPWYTMHKIFEGLISSYELAGNETALDIAKRLGDWVCERTSRWDESTQRTVLSIEYGGMKDCMYDLYRVTGEEKYRVRAGRIVDHVAVWARDNGWRIPEHFTSEWVPELECNKDKPDDQFKPYGATPGHGIEWARLITQWALSTYRDDREGAAPYLELSRNLYDRAVADAWDADGAPGIVYTTDWEGKPVVHDRMHWTLAEAINTSSVLWHVTGEQRYADDYARFMQYLDEKVLDHVNGSWFHQLDQNNNVIGTVWPGKSDLYHALQATLIPYHTADLSIAPAVKEGKEI